MENSRLNYKVDNIEDIIEKAICLIKMASHWEWNINQDTLSFTDDSFQYKTTPLPMQRMIIAAENSYNRIIDKPALISELNNLQYKPTVLVEYNLQDKKSLKTFEATLHLIKNKSGELILQCACQDITRLKETEHQLDKLKESFDYAERISQTGNWTYVFDNNKITCSDNFYHILGFELNSLDPTIENLLKVIPPDEYEKVKTKIVTDLKNNNFSELELKINTNDNQEKFIINRIKVVCSTFGNKMLIGTIHDITEQKRLQNKLQQRTTIAEMLIENSVDLISAFDNNLKFIAWNKKCEEFFHLKKNQVIGKHLSEVYPSIITEKLLQKLQKLKNDDIVHYIQHDKTNETYFENYIIPLHHGKGTKFGTLMITHDISEIRKSTNRLNQLNEVLRHKNDEFERSNQELASFSYVASHDLQEPLRKIQTFSHRLIEKELERLSPQGKEYITRMAAAAERMQRLIEDLLTFSRTNTAPRVFETVNLNDLLNDMLTDLKESIEEKNALIEYEKLPVITIIKFQFQQLMYNLILNSLKYQQKNLQPHIKITSETIDGSFISHLGANENLNFHKICIIDNGIGFENQYAEKIFDLFQRLHGKSEYPGTGLGLAICKRIIQNHNGFITAKGETGKGATFTIFLPKA